MYTRYARAMCADKLLFVPLRNKIFLAKIL